MPKIVWNVPIRMTVTFVRQVALDPDDSNEDAAIEAAGEGIGFDEGNLFESNVFFDCSDGITIGAVNCKEDIGKYPINGTLEAAPALAGDDHEMDPDDLLTDEERADED